MATYIVGDIQGCYDPLQRLLQEVRFDPAKDELWTPGDVVNRGGQSLETLRLLYSLGNSFRMTLGNHDLFLLRQNWRHEDGNTSNRELRKVLKAHDREALTEWLRHQPMAYWSDEHKLLMVHAGIVPQWSVRQALDCAAEVEQVLRSEKQRKFFRKMTKTRVRRWNDDLSGGKRRRLITSILTRMRFCDKNGKLLLRASGPPGSQPRPYKPWFKHKKRVAKDERIVFGHWAALGLHLRKNLVGLDSGCVWGGRLTALCVEENRIIQVPGMERR